jgi:hypothetical protein
LLDESFTVLRREVPEAHRRMCAELEGAGVAIRVNDESVIVACDGTGMRVDEWSGREHPSAEIRTSRKAILQVLNGKLAMANAVLTDAVRARASLETLVRLNRGLALYVHGAVRAPSFPELLKRFETGPRPSPARRRSKRR